MSRSHSFKLDGQGYRCENCNLYNDILTVYCRDCNLHRNQALEKAAIQTIFNRGLYREINIMADKSSVDKFQGFFNSGKILYSSMSFEKRREWRDELAEILMTARANLSAADWVDREESDKLTPEQRKWLVSNDEGVDSNNLAIPKIRKERMTKLDKQKEDMLKLGMDMKDINAILGEVQKVQSGGSITTSHTREMRDSKIVFTKTDKPSNNTQESLLGDISDSLVDGLKSGRPADDLESAAKTAGHIANKILGPINLSQPLIEEEATTDFPVNNSNNDGPTVNNSVEQPANSPFDASKLKFGV